MTEDVLAIPSETPPRSLSPKVYRAGTLTYTTAGLVAIFFWMLMGDFCYNLMELLIPKLVPLALRSHGASNALIGLIVGSIPGAMNMFISPFISTHSDRHRGRYGRRIPYLFWATPFIAAFLILIGCAETLGTSLYALPVIGRLAGSPSAVVLFLLAIFMVAFQFFNQFITTIYFYLFNDVVPKELMGRYLAFFRAVGAVAGFVFMRYIFGLAGTHFRAIFIGIGLVYFVAFMLMCWRVREGEYPPPRLPAAGPGLVSSVADYFHACFSLRFYLWFYLGTALAALAYIAIITFGVFFAQKNLGMTLDEFGKVMAWASVVAVVFYVPIGYLADKIHPLRLYLITLVATVAFGLIAFFFIQGQTSFLVITLSAYVGAVSFGVANTALSPLLLPPERYGQFCSAQLVILALASFVGNYGVGKFLDLIGDYRYIYLWNAAFAALALIPMLLLHAGWRRHGGPRHYLPPTR